MSEPLNSGSRKLWKVNADRRLLEPLTFQELNALRKYFDGKRYDRQRQMERRGGRMLGFTCDDCNVRHRCPFVYDIYSVRGECLAEAGKRIAEENDSNVRRTRTISNDNKRADTDKREDS